MNNSIEGKYFVEKKLHNPEWGSVTQVIGEYLFVEMGSSIQVRHISDATNWLFHHTWESLLNDMHFEFVEKEYRERTKSE